MKKEGNSSIYDLENIKPHDSILSGKRAYFLGSSVTEGAASLKCSFVEYISKWNSLSYYKEAVSGTTLADIEDESYIKRLERTPKEEEHFDFFVCQLSTNDASRGIPLGDIDSTDTTTVCGAINHIIDYVRNRWDCPIFFYTGSFYDKKEYSLMVDALYRIKERKDIQIIDMFKDKEFNNISDSDRSLYMYDPIHPMKAGYLKWWAPFMEERIIEYFRGETE